MASSVDGDIKLNIGIDTADVRKDANNLAKSVKSVFNSYMREAKNTSSSLLSIQNQMKKYSAELVKARAEQQRLANTEVYSDAYIDMVYDLEKVNREMTAIQTTIDKLKSKQESLREVKFSQEYAEYTKQIQEAQFEIDKLIAKKEYLDMKKSMGKSVDESEYTNIANDIDIATKNMNALVEAQNKFTSADVNVETAEYRALSDQITKLQSEYDTASNKANELKGVLNSSDFQRENIGSGVNTEAYAEATNKVTGLENKLVQLATKYKEVKKESNNTGEKIKKGFNGIQSVFNKVKKSIGNITNKLKEVGRNAKEGFSEMASSAKTSFAKLIRYGFGIRALFELIKRLKQYIADAFDTLGKSIPEVGAQLAEMKNSLGQVKNSLATAFQPILTAVIPILNSLCSVLVTAMNALGNFFATLTGQSFIYKATKATSGYADSISGTGSAAKEAKKELAAYDKLVVINQDNADSGSGGGGGGATGGGFEKVATEQSNLAKMIKDAWAKSDFTDVGKTIGTKLKEGLDSIKWTNIKKKASNIGKSLATFINGGISVKGLGSSIGSTIAESLNTALTFANTFVHTLNWGELGDFIGETISSALLTFDWDLASDTISTALNGLCDTILGITGKLKKNLPTILSKVSTAIGDFIKNFPAQKIGQIIGDIVNIVSSVGVELLPHIADMATQLGKTLQSAISSIDWANVGKLIGTALDTIITSVSNFLSEIDPESIGQAISDMFKNIDIPKLLDDALTLAEDIIGALAKAIGSVDWGEVGKTIGECLSTLASHIPDLIGALGSLALAILKGLGEAILGLAKENPLGAALVGVLVAIKLTGGLGGLASTILTNLATSIGSSGAISAISGAFSSIFSAIGPIAACVGTAIIGWNIGEKYLSPVVEEGLEYLDKTFGGELAKQEAIQKTQDQLSAIAQIGVKVNSIKADMKEFGEGTKEAMDVAEKGYEDLCKQIDETYDAQHKWRGELDKINSAVKLGIISDEERYKKLKEMAENSDSVWQKTFATLITKEHEIEQATSNLGEAAKTTTQSFSGMPTDAKKAFEESKKSAEDTATATKKATEDSAKHYEDLYKTKVPASAQEAKKAVEDSTKNLSSDTKKATEDTAKHYEELYKTKVPTSAQEAKKAVETTNKELEKTSKDSAKEMAKHYEDMYKPKNTNGVTKSINSIKSATSNVAKSVSANTAKMTKSWQSMSKSVNTNMTKTAKDSAKHFTNIYGSAKTNTSKTTKELNSINKNVKLDDMVKKIKTSFSDIQKDSYNKTIKDNNSVSKNFNKASDNATTSFNKSNFTDKLNTSFKNTAENAKTHTTGSNGISAKFAEGANKSKEKFNDTNFVSWLNTKFSNVVTKANTNISGSGGLISKFGEGATKSLEKFNNDNFVNKLASKFGDVVTQASNKNTGNGGIASKFGEGASQSKDKFSTNNFVNPIGGKFGEITSKAGTEATNTSNAYGSIYTSGSPIKTIFDNIFGLKNGLTGANNPFEAIRSVGSSSARGINNSFADASKTINSNMLSAIKDTINNVLSKLAGKFGIPYIPPVSSNFTPTYLAQGGVIPPNREFLAVLGDQKQGVNIETPLDTMVQAFDTALKNNGGGGTKEPIVLTLDGKVIAQAVWDENQRRYKQTGSYMFI